VVDTKLYTTGFATSKDGTTIAYRQLGLGPSLILLHGGMQAAKDLMRLATCLSDAFTLFIPNRRGRGPSGPHGDHYNMGRECEDLDALLAQTGAQNVFGLSSGALIALRGALTLPAIRKVAVYEPPLSIDHSSPTAWATRFDREVGEGKLAAALVTVLKGLQASPAFSTLPRWALVPLVTLALKNDDKSVADGDASMRTLIPTMHFDVQLVIETEGALESFRSIGAEVLLLGGSKSQAFLRIALDALSGALVRARRVEFQGLDHLGPANDGKPERVALELRKFFA
jgi:pimeloyl-ACP methyl ester carboxylesterase